MFKHVGHLWLAALTKTLFSESDDTSTRRYYVAMMPQREHVNPSLDMFLFLDMSNFYDNYWATIITNQ